jgi:hypothetical protein
MLHSTNLNDPDPNGMPLVPTFFFEDPKDDTQSNPMGIYGSLWSGKGAVNLTRVKGSVKFRLPQEGEGR